MKLLMKPGFSDASLVCVPGDIIHRLFFLTPSLLCDKPEATPLVLPVSSAPAGLNPFALVSPLVVALKSGGRVGY